ncbi:putative signal transduction protein [Opitutus terrae PB90-1]|uniref:Putative signal transduction protein n=2 Tax=Opitutus terrae TaxID=107709 RepID=B1ZRQ9_OPITP|nr:putative signal transduction protein [Opitutus terrae PB90-1]
MLLDPPLLESMSPPPARKAPYAEAVIKRRIEACPKLGSLQSINRALSELLHSEQSLNSQIAQIIRRDPSLTARLLRMVNSVYYGLSAQINNIEEAVFYLGLRQIRELSMATPVIEELEKLQTHSVTLPWKELWNHSIATAILTREILSATTFQIDDDTDYLIGLLHNVGKVIMANAFPDELQQLIGMHAHTPAAFCRLERELIGWDHAKIGAYYLEQHRISDEIITAVLHHNDPARAPQHQMFAAAVQVADHVVRHAGITGGFESVAPVEHEAWLKLDGWRILYGAEGPEGMLARAALANTLNRLPSMLQGLL